jgi:hypothetical protein
MMNCAGTGPEKTKLGGLCCAAIAPPTWTSANNPAPAIALAAHANINRDSLFPNMFPSFAISPETGASGQRMTRSAES